jgi:hypothetical protein
MKPSSPADARYYEAVKPHSLAERAMVVARDRIYADFLRLMAPRAHETLLDVGASDVITDAANALERKYPFPDKVTAAGLGEPDAFHVAFPQVDYRQIKPNAPLPFADNSFDIAMANAVLEHVGSCENQVFFVRELARVAQRVFIAVPHKYFPVEHHTGIPLLHFWRPAFVLACRILRKSEWADPANLILLTQSDLLKVAPADRKALAGHTGLMLGPFSSNLYLAIEPRA